MAPITRAWWGSKRLLKTVDVENEPALRRHDLSIQFGDRGLILARLGPQRRRQIIGVQHGCGGRHDQDTAHAAEVKELHAKIGQLTVDINRRRRPTPTRSSCSS